MRESDVQATRVIWRGNNGHAYLQFETDDKAHEAAKMLQVSALSLLYEARSKHRLVVMIVLCVHR